MRFIKWATEKTRNQAFINDYIDLMKITNGLQYNGLVIYNINQDDQNNSVYAANRIWWEQEWNRSYIFLADSSISWYCFDLTDNMYYELDKPSGDQIQEFSCLEELVTNAIDDVL
ncbi:YrhA family protein [Bhargavaea ginsengi]|uniref:YrhA family protein n=1 Tax=Bhargavaea ginsengi TaxID=426757 RepID=UPI003D813CE4